MTCATKVKRRATVSLCCLAMMDETEVGILFGVKRFDIQSVIENKDLPLQSKQSYGGYTFMVKESMGKSELFEKEKIKKRSDCFDRVIMVHQKLHE
ncbi:hypothetical protein ABH953_004908 [Bacillus sp. RC236]|uniref:Uncharacterized protein n=3 Tax=Bacillaceae TaxID=186817 RepID=A0A3D9UI70_BACMY|nr:hypothetical protein DET63_109128 [Bacillus sp. DB-2]REF28997.1 hypothetical protein DET55_12117 [Bacillus mycoides]